jgi:hypothetical protein
VTINSSNEESRSYALNRSDIAQFYENTSDDSRRAIVGLVAYVNGENPVSIRYSGTNFQDNLPQILRDPSRIRESGNEMRVWKGPGFPAELQHQIRDVVCQVSLQP